MTGFEYGLGVVSVVVGLSLTDVAQSTHRLLVRGRQVRWDPLTMLVAVYVLFTVVRMWFAIWRARDISGVVSFPVYISMFTELFVLYLIAAACLPDECPDEGVDLRAFYERRRRYLWTLFAVFQAGYVGHSFYFHAGDRTPTSAEFWETLIGRFAPLLTYVGLIFTGRRVLHYLGIAFVTALHLTRLWTSSL